MREAEPKLYDARHKPLVRRRVMERRYGVSPRCWDNWMRQGKVPFYRIGRMLFFSIEACDKALERFEVKAKG
jgi:hypothetical protein